MTLIAGFLSEGVPTLIGDFLITSGSDSIGTRKKLLIIADNLVLSWTGHQIAAASVFKTLQESLDPDSVTLESLKSLLTNPDISNLGAVQVTIVGWLVDAAGSHCFRWNSGYPSEMYFGCPMYDGSGDTTINYLIGDRPDGIRNPRNSTRKDGDVRSGLLLTTNLMKTELIGPKVSHLGFGFAYEIAMYRNNKFTYVDSVLYLSIRYEHDEQGKVLHAKFGNRICKYEARGNNAILHLTDVHANVVEVSLIQSVALSQPHITRDLLDEFKKPGYKFPFRSDYYCIFSTFQAPGFFSPPIATIVSGRTDHTNLPFSIEPNNTLAYKISRKFVEHAYAFFRNEQHKRISSPLGVDVLHIIEISDFGSVKASSDQRSFNVEYPLYCQLRQSDNRTTVVAFHTPDRRRIGIYLAGTPDCLSKNNRVSLYGRINNHKCLLQFLTELKTTTDDVIFVGNADGQTYCVDLLEILKTTSD